MKKIMALVLVLMLGTFCFAEEAQETVLADYAVAQEEAVAIDLDGDGDKEKLFLKIIYDDEYYSETVMITISDFIDEEFYYELCMANLYIMDINNDGVQEIFLSGDVMSYDFITYCFHYEDGKLLPVLFEDANRGGNDPDAMFDYGYGMLMSVDGNKIVLAGYQDILGTYFGSRVFEFKDDMFTLADDGLWLFERDVIDEETWEFAGIAPMQDIPVTFIADGVETEGVIAAGEKFLITASDKVSVVHFILQDGRTGCFAVEPDTETGWGVKVNGMNETELFEVLHYAG